MKVRRFVLPLALTALVSGFILSCSRPNMIQRPRITGTCEGVCRHYLSCKDELSAPKMKACVAECDEVFTGTTAHQAYQGLSCEDAISFVEGSSGRGPGTPTKHDHSAARAQP